MASKSQLPMREPPQMDRANYPAGPINPSRYRKYRAHEDELHEAHTERTVGGRGAFKSWWIFLIWLKELYDHTVVIDGRSVNPEDFTIEERSDIQVCDVFFELLIDLLEAQHTVASYGLLQPTVAVDGGKTMLYVNVNSRLNKYLFLHVTDRVCRRKGLEYCILHQTVFEISVSRSMRFQRKAYLDIKEDDQAITPPGGLPKDFEGGRVMKIIREEMATRIIVGLTGWSLSKGL